MHKTNLMHKLRNDLWAIRPDYFSSLIETARDMPEAGGPDDSEYYENFGGVAVVPVYGPLGKNLTDFEMMFMTDYQTVENALEEAEADPAVKTIVLDINSPGGTIQGLPELAQSMRNDVSKKTIAYTDGMMASAAYWMGSQAHYIISSPTAELGSVGVYVALLDETKALEMQGIKVETVSSGKHKLDYSPWKALDKDARARLQANVEKWHDRFKAEVNINRSIDDEYLEGQVFEGDEAIEINMSDATVNSLSELITLLQS